MTLFCSAKHQRERGVGFISRAQHHRDPLANRHAVPAPRVDECARSNFIMTSSEFFRPSVRPSVSPSPGGGVAVAAAAAAALGDAAATAGGNWVSGKKKVNRRRRRRRSSWILFVQLSVNSRQCGGARGKILAICPARNVTASLD